jgi:low temperature requirement protein LtrA
MKTPAPRPETDVEHRVTTLELFFDLVFVFAITQLTDLLKHELSSEGLLQVLLVFGVLWWMYSGYTWLTNTLAPDSSIRRLLLMLGMSGFLVLGLATPGAFTGDGVIWGVGYLLVVLVHAGLYLQVNPNILRIVPSNILAALSVIGAGAADGPVVYVLWALALAILVLTPFVLRVESSFVLRGAHFVERHGLLVLITFGESVVAIGFGAAGSELTVPIVGAAVLGLFLVCAMWWTYFVGDDELAEERMVAADDERRTQLALYYGYAHIPIFVGVIATAAGLKKVIEAAWEPLQSVPAAVALAGGVALYLVGDVCFRRVLGIGPYRLRLSAALLVLATIPLGRWVAEAEVIAVTTILAGMLVVEHHERAADPTSGSATHRVK